MASESGGAQTDAGVHRAHCVGVVGPTGSGRFGSGMVLERPTEEGESPVDETERKLVGILSTAGHANPVGIWGAHLPRLNTLNDR